MPCESSTGQCLSGPPPNGACTGADECPVCCPPFTEVYGFNAVDTFGKHPGCFVGLWSNGQSVIGEAREGRWCGLGCSGSAGDVAACDDSRLGVYADATDGRRFLRPNMARPPNRDARGLHHDVVSQDYHPVPAVTNWQRGTCWWNDGRECFVDTDVCACWARGDFVPNETGMCWPGAHAVGEALSHILPDTMVRIGHEWAPDFAPGNTNEITGQAFYCRKFADTRLGSERTSLVTLAAPSFGRVHELAEGMLAPAGLSFSSCVGNILVRCSATIERPPGDHPCLTSIWYTRGPGWYNEHGSRDRFAELCLDFSDPPRVELCPEATPQATALANLKNSVLDTIATESFDGRRFDRIDHELNLRGNVAMGRYERTWSDPAGVLVPNVFGPCRLAKAGCPVEATLHLTFVGVFAFVHLFYLRTGMGASSLRWVEPYIKLLIVAGLETRVALPDECALETWDGRSIPLALNGLNVQPEGLDWIEFMDREGRSMQQPPLVVEWRGSIDGHSRPRSMDFRRRLDLQTEPVLCDAVADLIQHVPVTGLPSAADSQPDSPNTLYGGQVKVSYRTQGFACP